MFARYLHRPFWHFKGDYFDLMLLILAPLITTVNGIAIDLYTPSLPAVSQYFHVSDVAAKWSVSMGLIGFGLGVLLFGGLSDLFGRRKLIITGLVLFILASVVAQHAQLYSVFMSARFFQGAGVACAAMLARAALLDHFTGAKLYTAMLYTTMAWGAGPVIAPFIGGYLQHHFGWQANFQAYAIWGVVNLIAVVLFLGETLPPERRDRVPILKRYISVFSDKQFLLFMFFCCFCFIMFMSYNLFGSFLVQERMGYSAQVFGDTALCVGLGYLLGSIVNRLLLRWMSPRQAMLGAMVSCGLSVLLMFGLCWWQPHSLIMLVVPIVFLTFGVGILFPNAIAKCLENLSQNAGSAASLHGGSVMTIGFVLTTVLSLIPVYSGVTLAAIIGGAWLVNLGILGLAIRAGKL